MKVDNNNKKNAQFNSSKEKNLQAKRVLHVNILSKKIQRAREENRSPMKIVHENTEKENFPRLLGI